MKITKLLLICVAALLFSCSDDDDDVKATVQGMIGEWNITDLDYNGTTTTSAQGMNITANFTGTGKDMDLTTIFTASPNTVTTEGSYTIVLESTTLGQTTTNEVPFTEVFTDGTWTLEGNTLKVTGPNGTDEATIVEQTSTTLKFKVDVDETESGSGFTVKTVLHATYTFTKK
jgi:hypothetical protein